jgi:serine/threonine protein kinase
MQPGSSRNPDRHRRVRAIFDAAMALPADDRLNFVRQQSNGDIGLEAEISRLLGAVENARQGGFLEQPAWKRQPGTPPVREGMAFGAYRLLRQLGGGGMGAVYLVERSDDVFHKMAALKVIRPECMTGELLRRFQQERRILAELDHPNIARIVDGGTTTDGLPYFVMDYVKGEHIDKYCSTRRFSVDQKLRLFIQVCNAVEYLHAHRIIHRDLKPSNIVVTGNGNVKLLDFGIAKALTDSGTGNTKTTRVMTPGYASPEQMTGHGVTTASDVYSLAILLCELLTGSRPFPPEAEPTPALLMGPPVRHPAPPSTMVGTNQMHVSAESPAHLRQRLQGDLDTIILTALRNEPERRYQRAGDFASDLELHLVGRPVFARKDSVTYRASKFVKRNRARIATAVVILILAIWAVWATWWRAGEREARQSVAQAKAHQREGLKGDTLADLRKVNEAYSTMLARAIEKRPGATPERSNLVVQDEQYLDSVRRTSANDPAVLLEVARGYLTLGDLKGYPKQANLGDRTGALALYEKAQSILLALPENSDVRQVLQTVNDHAAATRAAG